MSAPPIESLLLPGNLLSAVEQLGKAELEGFVSQVLALQARRRAPSLPADEAELLLRVNQGLPAEERARFEELEGLRESEALTPAQHAELLALVERLEAVEAGRVGALSQLATLRGVSLPALMQQLGLARAHDD